MSPHEMQDIKVFSRWMLQHLFHQRKQLLIQTPAVFVRLPELRILTDIAALCEQLCNIPPYPGAFLIRQPVRTITGRLHHINEIIALIPFPVRFDVMERKELPKHSHRSTLRTDYIPVYRQFPFLIEFIEIRRIFQRISIKMQPVPIR